MTFELFGLSLFFAFSLGLVAWFLLNSLREVQEEAEEQFEVYSTSPLYRAALPFVQYIGRRLEGVRLLAGLRYSLDLRLTHAGKGLSISPDEFMALMIVYGSCGVVVSLLYYWMMKIDPLYAALIPLMTAFLPYASLGKRAELRKKAIRRILPYTLDLLCLAVEAGLDFSAALNRIAEKLKKNPFRDELRLLSRDLTMGKTRPEALRDLEHRCGVEELTAVVSALVQADELGASLGPTLRIQSQELQRKRFQRAEKKAMQAPVLMLLPLVGCIFPLVLIIIIVPIVLRAVEQFS